MNAPRERFVEGRYEVKLSRRIADIRPWTDKAAESLSDRFTLTIFMLPLLVTSAVIPLLSFIALPIAITLIITHKTSRQTTLPMRYPAINPEPDPTTKKPGKGIMFFGNQDSTSPFEKAKELWASDDDLRKHMLILGATGSGKSETLKSLFFNALCWSSGFFIADGKADNKLPTDVFTMVRSVGMDDNLLTLNFLLAGKTPEQVRTSRRRRTNKLNPFTSADADTIIQMGANMLPKVEGDGKSWQEKALNLWRAQIVALCYKRDTQGFELSVSTIVDYMSIAKIEELFIEGFKEAKERENNEWSYGFTSIKTYLESGCPAYSVQKLLAKHGLDAGAQSAGQAAFGARPPAKPNANEQDPMSGEQHGYRTSQLMPVLNLLDKTYGHIFKDKFPEIDMIDVTLNNRIMTMLIPSLEKSAQEAENLGKLAIACLRVMMARNLGGGVEGTRIELLESKATNAPYPYLVALDELGYYFSDGIAVIFAQARSLGFSMIPAAQDLEKLTEGNRAAEAGAMMSNSVTKIVLRIDDPKKTWEYVQGIVQKATVAVYKNFEFSGMGWSRKTEVDLIEMDRVSLTQLQGMEAGQGLINAVGKTTRFRSYYMDSDLKKHRADNFYVLRFVQVNSPTDQDVNKMSRNPDVRSDPAVLGERMRLLLTHEVDVPDIPLPQVDLISAIRNAALAAPEHLAGDLRAIVLFEAARRHLLSRRKVANAAAEEAWLEAPAVARGEGDDVEPPMEPKLAPWDSGAGEPALLGRDGTPFATPSRNESSAADDVRRLADDMRESIPGGADAAAAGDEHDYDLSALLGDEPEIKPRPSTPARVYPAGSVQPPAQQSQQSQPAPDTLDVPDPDFSIDVEEALGTPMPFERKAIMALRAGDAGLDAFDAFDLGRMGAFGDVAHAAQAVASADERGELVDPVDTLIGDVRFFSMPKVIEPEPGQSASDALAGEIVRAAVAMKSETKQAGEPHPPIPAEPLTRAAEDDWVESAVKTAVARPSAVVSTPGIAVTGVGFTAQTAKTLVDIESVLGNTQPQTAIEKLEGIMSVQLSAPLAAQKTTDDGELKALIGALDALGLLDDSIESDPIE